MQKNDSGFTLIEMMVTLAILGVLLAIAMPSYKSYTIRNNRAAVQSEMLQMAGNIERYRARQLSYKGVDTALGASTAYPKSGGKRLYTILLTPDPNGGSWVITAVPENSQKVDGTMKLDSLGRKCWDKTSTATCDLTNPAQAWSVR
jgi:type IV pilus assembly protein PilE